MDWQAIAGISILSCILPAAIYVGRNNIRARRRELIRELESLFDFAKDSEGNRIIIPSFELVKYKYNPSPDQEKDPNAPIHYICPGALFIILSISGFVFCFLGYITEPPDNLNYFVKGNQLHPSAADLQNLFAMLCYAFLGGYIWSIHYLIKRVSNFDLSPLSFLRTSAHIIFGSFVVGAVWHTTLSAFHVITDGDGSILREISVGSAFLIGMYPNLALDKLFAKYPSFRLRRVKSATKRLYEEIPLDCILGIDPFMKFRLAEFEIEDVQNLATMNPIQLFVETPYGLYELIDWIAQAQLIVAVGSAKTEALRQYNIRTIFDLDKALSNSKMKSAILPMLLSAVRGDAEISLPANGQAIAGDVALGEEGVAAETLQTQIDIIEDDLHVRRLRQLWNVIASRLDEVPRKGGKVLPLMPVGNDDRAGLASAEVA